MKRFLQRLFILLLISPTLSMAQNDNSMPEALSVEILGGQYEYEVSTQTLNLRSTNESRAAVLWGERSVTADTIVYREADRIVEATGDVRLWDEGFILRGDYARYDLNANEGLLDNAKEAELAEGLYFTGGRMEYKLVPADVKNATDSQSIREYTLYDGSFTPNDLPVPHYHFKYERIVIIPGDELRMYSTTAVVQGWPLMFLPYYQRSLGENKVTYYIEFGYDSDLGASIENRVNIELTKSYIFDFYGDYFTKAGIGKGMKFNFDVPHEYGPKGYVYGYHIKQEAPDNDNIHDGDDRYLIAGEYTQNLPYDMRLSAKGHFSSDSEYTDDYGSVARSHELNDREIERESVSHVSLTKYTDEQSFRITGARRFDNFYFTGLPYVEREPQVHIEQYPTRLFDTGLYGSLQLDYGRYRREEGVTYPLNRNTLFDQTTYRDEIDRYDANLMLEHPFYLPQRFTVTPWLGYRGTYYYDPTRFVDDPSTGVRDFSAFNFGSESRNILQAGIEASTRRTMDMDPFLDRYEKMRAVFEPVIDYGFYDPDTALEQITSGPGVRFPYIDPVDDYRFQMHHVGALVRTRIQGKNANGGISDFMRLSTGFSFDYAPEDNILFDSFEFYDDTSNNTDHRFSDLVEDFQIFPAEWVMLGNSLRYDIDDSEMRSSLYYARFTPIERLTFDVGYNTFRYPFIDIGEQQDAVYGIQYQLSNKWEIFYRGRYDLNDGVVRQNDIGFLRDMYDFFTVVGLEHTSHPTLGDDYSIRFRIGWWGINRQNKGNTEVFRSPAARFY